MIIVNSKLIRFHANDLLDHRIIESGQFVPSLSVSSVGDVMEEIIEMMNWNIQKRNLKIQFIQEQKGPQYLSFDKRRLQQVLLNLLSNAIKFTAKGTIEVYVNIEKAQEYEGEANENLIKVSVRDKGIGMTDEDQQRVFDLDWCSRSSMSRECNPNGNGIGLYICK